MLQRLCVSARDDKRIVCTDLTGTERDRGEYLVNYSYTHKLECVLADQHSGMSRTHILSGWLVEVLRGLHLRDDNQPSVNRDMTEAFLQRCLHIWRVSMAEPEGEQTQNVLKIGSTQGLTCKDASLKHYCKQEAFNPVLLHLFIDLGKSLHHTSSSQRYQEKATCPKYLRLSCLF